MAYPLAGRSTGGGRGNQTVIHQNVIKRKADTDGVSAPNVERDYVLTHVLATLSGRDEEGQFVFKGGTALRLCYFGDYRYSADLDFSLATA